MDGCWGLSLGWGSRITSASRAGAYGAVVVVGGTVQAGGCGGAGNATSWALFTSGTRGGSRVISSVANSTDTATTVGRAVGDFSAAGLGSTARARAVDGETCVHAFTGAAGALGAGAGALQVVARRAVETTGRGAVVHVAAACRFDRAGCTCGVQGWGSSVFGFAEAVWTSRARSSSLEVVASDAVDACTCNTGVDVAGGCGWSD